MPLAASAKELMRVPPENLRRPALMLPIAVLKSLARSTKPFLPSTTSVMLNKSVTLPFIFLPKSSPVNKFKILPIPNAANPAPMPVIAKKNVPPSFNISVLPPKASAILNSSITFAFMLVAKLGFAKFVNASDMPATAAPAPNTASPKPIPVIARRNVPESPKNAPAPPNSSLILNNTFTFSFILVANWAFENWVSASDIPAIALPAPNTASPKPIPVIASTNVPDFLKNSPAPPSKSS